MLPDLSNCSSMTVLALSFDSSDKTQISVTYKAVLMYNNNEMWIDGQNHVSNYALYLSIHQLQDNLRTKTMTKSNSLPFL